METSQFVYQLSDTLVRLTDEWTRARVRAEGAEQFSFGYGDVLLTPEEALAPNGLLPVFVEQADLLRRRIFGEASPQLPLQLAYASNALISAPNQPGKGWTVREATRDAEFTSCPRCGQSVRPASAREVFRCEACGHTELLAAREFQSRAVTALCLRAATKSAVDMGLRENLLYAPVDRLVEKMVQESRHVARRSALRQGAAL